jgi:hypothetical protein
MPMTCNTLPSREKNHTPTAEKFQSGSNMVESSATYTISAINFECRFDDKGDLSCRFSVSCSRRVRSHDASNFSKASNLSLPPTALFIQRITTESDLRRKLMRFIKVKRIIGLVVLFAVAVTAPAAIPAAQYRNNSSAPQLPSNICADIQVPAGNEVFFHAYARGLQVYRWDGSTWVGTPSATLFADDGYHAQVGTHYGGPTWESNSGSYVKAGRDGICPSPDPNAIPWLRLKTTSTNGPGVFSPVTYIQRVNTTGGKAPSTPGSFLNESVEVSYTAEYYFYRAED